MPLEINKGGICKQVGLSVAAFDTQAFAYIFIYCLYEQLPTRHPGVIYNMIKMYKKQLYVSYKAVKTVATILMAF